MTMDPDPWEEETSECTHEENSGSVPSMVERNNNPANTWGVFVGCVVLVAAFLAVAVYTSANTTKERDILSSLREENRVLLEDKDHLSGQIKRLKAEYESSLSQLQLRDIALEKADQALALAEKDRKNAEQKRLARLRAEKRREQVRKEIEDLLRQSIPKEQATIDREGVFIIIRLDNAILFDGTTSKLQEVGQVVLKNCGDVLAQRLPGYNLHIEGHTDNIKVGPNTRKFFPNNRALSAARASSVADYLAQTTNFQHNQLKPVGMGPHQPIASNENKEGRTQNRRIELIINLEETPERPTEVASE